MRLVSRQRSVPARPPPSPFSETKRRTCSPTCWFTTWASGWRTAFRQGQAGPRDFRTAPLWRLGQRVFFLHDGRTADLRETIQAHSRDGSEANGVINRFNNLSESTKQDLFNFLRSL
jgi:hypothetical protein